MRRIPFGLAVIAVCGLIVLAGGIRAAIWLHQAEAISAVQGTLRNQLLALQQTSEALTALENGKHGYLLTGTPSDFDSFARARDDLAAALERLDPVFRGSPMASEIAEIIELVKKNERGVLRAIEHRREIGRAPAPEEAAADANPELLGAVRAQLEGLVNRIRSVLATLDDEQGSQFRNTLLLLAGIVLVVDLLIVVALVTLSLAIYRMRERQAEREREAMHDALTLLPNRRYLTEWLSMSLARARRSHDPLAVLYLDLDGFKSVNDRFGHEAGDRVLQSVAMRLRGALRLSDFVARLGGDEFVAALPDAPSDQALEILIGRLHAEIAKAPIEELEDGAVQASIGSACFPTDGDTVDALLAAADRAMYGVKERRRAKQPGQRWRHVDLGLTKAVQ